MLSAIDRGRRRRSAPTVRASACTRARPPHKVYGFSITIAGHRQPVRAPRRRRRTGCSRATPVRHLHRRVGGRGLRRRRRHRCALHQRGERGAVALLRRARRTAPTREAVDVLSGGRRSPDQRRRRRHHRRPARWRPATSSSRCRTRANPNASYFSVYQRGRGQRLREDLPGRQRHRPPTTATAPTASRPSTANLGPAFPNGVFICQDNNNDLPGSRRQPGPQARPAREGREPRRWRGSHRPPPPDDPSPISFVGQATSNTNSTAFTVRRAVRTSGRTTCCCCSPPTASTTAPDRAGHRVDAGRPGGRHQPRDHGLAPYRGHRADAGQRRAPDHQWRRLHQGRPDPRGLPRRRYRPTRSSRSRVQPEPGSSTAHTTPVVSNTTTGRLAGVVLVGQEQRDDAVDRAGRRDGARHHLRLRWRHGSERCSPTPRPACTASTPATTGGLTAHRQREGELGDHVDRPAAPGRRRRAGQPAAGRTVHLELCTVSICSFDASTSSDPEDSIESYEWDFGDGNDGEGGRPRAHATRPPAPREVVLTVTDDDGATDTADATRSPPARRRRPHRSRSWGRRPATPTTSPSRCACRRRSRPTTPCCCSPRRGAAPRSPVPAPVDAGRPRGRQQPCHHRLATAGHGLGCRAAPCG